MSEATAVLETQASAPATQPEAVTAPGDDGLDPAILAELRKEYEEVSKTEQPAAQDAKGTVPEPTGTAPDAAPADDVDPEEAAALETIRQSEREAGKAEGAQETRQQIDEQQRANQLNQRFAGVRQDFQERAPRIRAHLLAVQEGRADLDVDGLLNEFNAHHQQAGMAVAAQFMDAVHEFADAVLPPEAAAKFHQEHSAATFQGYRPMFEAIHAASQDKSREGYVPQQKVDDIKAGEFLRGINHVKSHLDAYISRWRPAPSRAGVTGGNPSDSSFNADTASVEQIQAHLKAAGIN